MRKIQELEVSNAKPNISNLPVCIENIRRAVLSNRQGPEDPTDFYSLRTRIEAVKDKFPVLYQKALVQPFMKVIDGLGPEKFMEILLRDPQRNRAAGLMLDIAQAILQNGEGYNAMATDAFQEIVSDLYDGFLSAEDREGIAPPDLSVIPAIVKWGNPENGPYTWPIGATSSFELETAVVSLPPIHAETGILAWGSIPHEICGHNILHADTGLMNELKKAVRNGLLQRDIGPGLAEYWAARVDETASDVLGVLNLGPSAAISLIGYFRGINAAYAGNARLRNQGPAGDVHPADILRGYLGAYATGLLKFDQAGAWEKLIESETDQDLSAIRLEGVAIDSGIAKQSARIVAQTIMKTKLQSLENHSLDQIQNWKNGDESITATIRGLLSTAGSLDEEYRSGFYAAHVVAAAVTEVLAKNDGDLDVIFARMVTLLKVMHDKNPSWGPLFIKHPGDISRHLIYYREDELHAAAYGD